MSSKIVQQRIEYVYLIRHIPTGKFYAGSKFAKKRYCNPDSFWNLDHKYAYFTSSKTIKQLILDYGYESFEVLEIIPRPLNDAQEYETLFLESVNAAKNDNWLNLSNGRGKLNSSNPLTAAKIGEAHKGRKQSKELITKRANSLRGYKHSNETKAKQSKSRKGKPSGREGKTNSEESKLKISKANTGKVCSDETKSTLSKIISNSIWINDGIKSKRIPRDTEIPEGFVLGRAKKIN